MGVVSIAKARKLKCHWQGFFQGGAGGSIRPPLEAGCPPLRGPPITYSYSIIFDIVHVESFPLIVNGISFLK